MDKPLRDIITSVMLLVPNLKPMPNTPVFKVGNLIFLKGDRDQTKAKEKSLITNISDDIHQVPVLLKVI